MCIPHGVRHPVAPPPPPPPPSPQDTTGHASLEALDYMDDGTPIKLRVEITEEVWSREELEHEQETGA